MASPHHAKSTGLCRPPPAVSHISDSVRSVFRSTPRGQDCFGVIRRVGSLLVLLAADPLSRALRARVAHRPAPVFGAVSLPNEHGQGAALCDCLPRDRDSPVFQKEILAVTAARTCLHLDLRHVRASRYGGGVLDDCHRDNGKTI